MRRFPCGLQGRPPWRRALEPTFSWPGTSPAYSPSPCLHSLHLPQRLLAPASRLRLPLGRPRPRFRHLPPSPGLVRRLWPRFCSSRHPGGGRCFLPVPFRRWCHVCLTPCCLHPGLRVLRAWAGPCAGPASQPSSSALPFPLGRRGCDRGPPLAGGRSGWPLLRGASPQRGALRGGWGSVLGHRPSPARVPSNGAHLSELMPRPGPQSHIGATATALGRASQEEGSFPEPRVEL